MQYMRGRRSDYNELAKHVGSDEWSWDNLLPYFRKHEHLEADNRATYPASAHGIHGPVHTSTTKSQIPIENPFLDACNEIARFNREVQDPTNGSHDSFFASLSTVDRTERPGTRSYAASAYVLPNLHRPNLKILTKANVANVLFDTNKSALTAIGVRFKHSALEYTATAKKEVILSAGTYKTPQLLELSGIGDPVVLKSAGVECLVPNPSVGSNLQDHTAFLTTFELAPGGFSVDAFAIPEVVQPFMELYQATGTGPLASPPAGMGFLSYAAIVSPKELQDTVSVAELNDSTDKPLAASQLQLSISRLRDPSAGAIQILFVPAHIDADEGRRDQSKFIQPASTGNNHVTAITCFHYPLSRGSVHITSSNPEVQPAIDPAFLSHPVDMAVLRAVLPFLNKVSVSPALKDQWNAGFSLVEKFGLGSKSAEEEYIRNNVGTEHHPIGTAAMGDVVDTQLKVKGVQGLRCVDASVLPTNISGNPMATIYAIAEKAVVMIRDAYEKDEA